MLETIHKLVAGAIVLATTTAGVAQVPSVMTIVPSKQALLASIEPVETAIAEGQYKPQPLETKAQMEEFLRVYALEKGVSYRAAHFTITCESNWDPKIQSVHVRNGVREQSFGLAQIHLPSHPKVTRAEAQDPEFAIRFLVDHFADGNAKLWTCWRDYYRK